MTGTTYNLCGVRFRQKPKKNIMRKFIWCSRLKKLLDDEFQFRNG